MKNLLIFLLAALPLLSCQEFLTEDPESFVAPENLFTTDKGAIAALNGAYASLNSYRSGKVGLVGNLGTDEAQIGLDERSQAASTGVDDYGANLNPVNSIVTGFWTSSYYVIVRANLVINFTPKVPDIDPGLRDRVVGEAMFLRALSFLQLATYFGGVPVSTSYEANRDNPRRPVEEVYGLIIDDLTFAAQHLPDKGSYTGNDVGRATRQAAQTLLAKARVSAPGALRDYGQAATLLRDVIDFAAANPAILGLEDDYATLFTPDYENGKESIFEFQFLRPEQTNNMGVVYGSRYNGMTNLTIPGAGSADGRPTDYVYGLFSDDDARRPVTFRTAFFDAAGNPIAEAANPEYLKPHVKKYEDPLAVSQARGGRNIIFLRYADVLLLYAEVLLQTGGDPQPWVTAVRDRAGVPPLPAVTLDALLEERARELAFENWRWFDLKRTGKLIEYTEARHPYATSIAPEKTLWPIPQDEIQTNDGIDVADQNPGY